MASITEALAKVPFRITNPELIPTERYYDPAFFELENKHLWPHAWQMAGRLEEIPQVGDYTVYNILEHSVLLIHTKNGVKAFKNACRHRGVRLATKPGHCGTTGLVCPFHGWRWNEDGESTFIFGREVFSDELLERAEVDLVPIRTEFWAGCAFINFDDDALPLRECLGPVAERMDARHADKLKMDWWYGTVLPTNWKLANEAFQEGYHTMQTHPQVHLLGFNSSASYGPTIDGKELNKGLTAREAVDLQIKSFKRLSSGMGGMVHETELAVMDRVSGTIDLPDDPERALELLYGTLCTEITKDAQARGAPMFDILKVVQEQVFYPVEFMFPHFFLLPTFGAMASYRIRPLTPETCFFELWSLVIRPEGEAFDTPTEPTILAHDSKEFPEIPRQDYSNLPRQQMGLHDIDVMRLAKGKEGRGNSHNGGEGMISNCHRLIDGFIAGIEQDKLAKAQAILNCGFESPILDIGF
jgi:phenylpropionate dioxygenase-like ring-hydroxylating dioxygenase large terminal subunit